MASVANVQTIVESQEEANTITIYQPNGDPYLSLEGKPSTMDVVGSESKRYREAEVQENRKLIRSGRGKLTPEQLRSQRINRATAAVAAWYGWDDGKKDLPCTPENVKEFIRHEHILRQVEVGIEDHAGFSGMQSES